MQIMKYLKSALKRSVVSVITIWQMQSSVYTRPLIWIDLNGPINPPLEVGGLVCVRSGLAVSRHKAQLQRCLWVFYI